MVVECVSDVNTWVARDLTASQAQEIRHRRRHAVSRVCPQSVVGRAAEYHAVMYIQSCVTTRRSSSPDDAERVRQ